MDGILPPIAIPAAPFRFSIHRDDLSAFHCECRFYPLHKPFLKCLSVQQSKFPSKRVVRRYSRWQLQVALQPFQLGFPELLHLTPTFCPTQHGAHRYHDNFSQDMVTPTLYSRIRHIAKTFFQTLKWPDDIHGCSPYPAIVPYSFFDAIALPSSKPGTLWSTNGKESLGVGL